jgi:hypothetical protein
VLSLSRHKTLNKLFLLACLLGLRTGTYRYLYVCNAPVLLRSTRSYSTVVLILSVRVISSNAHDNSTGSVIIIAHS